MLSTTSSTESGSFPFSIFRGTLRFWFALNIIIATVTLGVHYFALNVDQSSSLALHSLRLELVRKCDPASIDALLAAEAERGLATQSLLGHLLSTNTPPASLFAMRVWVEEAALLPAVHATLRTVNDRLIASAPPSLTRARRQYAQQVMLHRLVRIDPPPADLWHVTPSAPVVSDAATREDGAEVATLAAAPFVSFTSLAHAQHLLVQRARDQQLGLATLQHAFTPDPKAQLQTMSVSLIHLPAPLHASYLGWVLAPHGSESERAQAAAHLMNDTGSAHRGTHCESFDAHQFYCVLPPLPAPSPERRTRRGSKRAVEAALTSVLAADMHIDTFRDTNFMQLFFLSREQAGCVHAYRSVVALQQSMKDYPDMKVPHSVHPSLATLRQLVAHNQFVLASAAADALQYHPLLTPQLYIPFDHNVVSHVLIFLPVLSLVLLCLRFLRDMRRVDAKASKEGRAASCTGSVQTPAASAVEGGKRASPAVEAAAPPPPAAAATSRPPKSTRSKGRKEE